MNTQKYSKQWQWTILLFLLATTPLFSLKAQPDRFGQKLEQSREQIEAFRIAFITRRLQLTQEEAQRFWPVYNQLTSELESLRSTLRQMQREMRQAYMGSSDGELEKLSDDYIQTQSQESGIRLKYHEEFKKVLPIRKVLQLYKAEEDMKVELLKELRQRQQRRGGRN